MWADSEDKFVADRECHIGKRVKWYVPLVLAEVQCADVWVSMEKSNDARIYKALWNNAYYLGN